MLSLRYVEVESLNILLMISLFFKEAKKLIDLPYIQVLHKNKSWAYGSCWSVPFLFED